MRLWAPVGLALVMAGCGVAETPPDGSLDSGVDTSASDAPSRSDALRPLDGGPIDGGTDAPASLDGPASTDSSADDAPASLDSGPDAPSPEEDTGVDTGTDAPPPFDAGTDAGVDAPPPFDAGTDTPPDVPTVDAPVFTPAPHTPAPPLLSLGGATLTDPAIVTMTYSDDTRRDEIEAFGVSMTTDTAWWTASVAEYGIGPVAHLADVRLAAAAPARITQTQIETFLGDQAAMGSLPTRAGSYEGIVYMLYFPLASRVTLRGGAASCSGWHGVHGEVTRGAIHFAYALDVMCGPGRGLSDLGYLEAAASHELLEAVTDPFPNTDPAYAVPFTLDPWAVYGELTDRCVGQYLRRTGYVLARNWSNAAAAAGTDPCVPGESPYYNVTTPATTVHAVAGTAISIPITGWSTGPVPDFRIAVGRVAGFNCAPTLDRAMVNNGVMTMLNATFPAGTTPGTGSWVVVTSGPDAGDQRNFPILFIAD